jgi:hypothetical protein
MAPRSDGSGGDAEVAGGFADGVGGDVSGVGSTVEVGHSWEFGAWLLMVSL